MNECKKHAPDWLSVPQFPHADDSSRNKINRLLAEATGEWKSASNFSGSLILPAVFCSKSQLASKSSRNTKIKAILDSFEKANADGVWTVDESLTDWDGSESFIRERFPAVIALQSELNSSAKLPSNAIKIAGPYWGLNLLLWSRELIQYPAISLGTGWKYNLSGGMPRTGTPRIMISHLKRPVEAQPEMAAWFASAIAAAGPAIEARNELIALSAKLQNYQFDREEARAQLNGAYKAWLDVICSTPDKGRAVALYQDFSTAYVFGSTLPDLPIEGTGRRPGQVAKTFMLSCLGH